MPGAFVVNVEDELTYWAPGLPLVEDAIGKLIDPVTGLTD